MGLAKDSLSTNAMGGTELMKYGLMERLPEELLNEVQIFVSRVEEELDETKIRIYWCHDLAGDPATEHLANGGWNKFHKIVFISHWQMNEYINKYNIPWSKCTVLQNAINPFTNHDKPNDGTIRLAYWSTPHRGLNILYAVFDKLCEKYNNIELDVYSSFNLYGWGQRDEQFRELLDACEAHPKINYYGSVPNEELRAALEKTHILAYPSIWQETSCIVLMEAMSAGLLCVHPNNGALFETSANWTHMYQWNEDINMHANYFYQVLDNAIENYWNEGIQSSLKSQSSYANVFYNWNMRAYQWKSLIESQLNEPRELPEQSASGQYFYFKPQV